eukprot:2655130-Alexandrium_andersonii.AAC.1
MEPLIWAHGERPSVAMYVWRRTHVLNRDLAGNNKRVVALHACSLRLPRGLPPPGNPPGKRG